MKIRRRIDLIRIKFNLLPDSEQAAKAMGRRAALAGSHAAENPWGQPMVKARFMNRLNGFWEFGDPYFSFSATPCENMTKGDRLSRAWFLGFGEVIWKKMRVGYDRYLLELSRLAGE